METSPSHSAGQGGGAQWSAQTGHPTVVMDRFHQGAYRLTGEMQTEEPIFICQEPSYLGLEQTESET